MPAIINGSHVIDPALLRALQAAVRPALSLDEATGQWGSWVRSCMPWSEAARPVECTRCGGCGTCAETTEHRCSIGPCPRCRGTGSVYRVKAGSGAGAGGGR